MRVEALRVPHRNVRPHQHPRKRALQIEVRNVLQTSHLAEFNPHREERVGFLPLRHDGLTVGNHPARQIRRFLGRILRRVRADRALPAQSVRAAPRALLAAVRRGFRGIRPLALAQEEFLRHAAIDDIPRQNLVKPPFAVRVERGVNPRSAEYIHPLVVIEILVPRVKTEAFATSQFERVAQPSVSARQNRLDQADPCVVVLIAHMAVGNLAFQVFLLLAEHFHGVLRLPLERRKRLRNEAGNADRHRDLPPLGAVGILIVGFRYLLRKARDSLKIIEGFGGQSLHKIQFDRRFARVEGNLHRPKDLILAHILVDNIAQALRSRLWREGQGRRPHRRDAIHQFAAEIVHPQGRERQADHILIGP